MAYDNPKGIIAASAILEALVIGLLGLRLYGRKKNRQSLIVSDYLILLAFIFGTGLTVIEIYGSAAKALGVPLGANLLDPTAVNGRLNKSKHIQLAYLLIGTAALGTIKVSISFFYLRVFQKPIFTRIIICWIIVLIAWTVTFVVGGLLECGSRLGSLFGTPQSYLSHCGHAIPTGWALVGSNLATDFITLIIPVPMIWSLEMRTPKKLAITATFLVGSLSVGASIAKAYIYISSSLGDYKLDAILLITAFSVWNLVEVQVGIMAACGPLLGPAFRNTKAKERINHLIASLERGVSNSSSTNNHRDMRGYRQSVSNDAIALSRREGNNGGKGASNSSLSSGIYHAEPASETL